MLAVRLMAKQSNGMGHARAVEGAELLICGRSQWLRHTTSKGPHRSHGLDGGQEHATELRSCQTLLLNLHFETLGAHSYQAWPLWPKLSSRKLERSQSLLKIAALSTSLAVVAFLEIICAEQCTSSLLQPALLKLVNCLPSKHNW